MDVVVGFLIAWASGKARRVGIRIDGLADQALDKVAERAWAAVAVKLGAHPAIQNLVSEARDRGWASSETQNHAASALREVAERDPQFAEELRLLRLTVPSDHIGNVENSVQVNGSITAGGAVSISNVVNYAKRNPFIAISLAIAAIAVFAFTVRQIIVNSGPDVVDSGKILGSWNSSDGSGIKTVFKNDGLCHGFYYEGGRPIDIGGPMLCKISEDADEIGRYSFKVHQITNDATYQVHFDSNDHVVIYASTGERMYELARVA